MANDIFGDLTDWGPAIEKIQALRVQQDLDRHQPGLTRILRYRDNWRLREAVLKCVKDVRYPNAELLDAVLAVLKDANTYHDTRLMAAEGLANVFSRKKDRPSESQAGLSAQSVLAEMDGLLGTPQAPVFHKELRRIREWFASAIGEPVGAA